VISIVNASRPGMKKEGHMGVGLENVRRTVEAYQGTMQCEIVGEEYRVSVMLPGKEDS
jgi:two-component system sensor histidine kinase AgrC